MDNVIFSINGGVLQRSGEITYPKMRTKTIASVRCRCGRRLEFEVRPREYFSSPLVVNDWRIEWQAGPDMTVTCVSCREDQS